MAARTIEIRFLGDASDAKRAMAEIDDSGGKLEGRLGGLKSAFGGVATVAGGIIAAGAIQQLGGQLMGAVQGAIEDEAATKRLEQALKNVGGAYDENLAKVNEAIAAGQKKAFTDDQVRDSFQTLLGATGDVNESLNRQKLAYDLSRGAGISLEQATRMVAKVNEESVDTFKRLGINIADGATEAEALAAVQEKFAGQADAYAQSTAGQFEQANIRLGEVKEQIGAALIPVIARLGSVFLNDVVPAVEKFVNAAGPAIRQFAQDVRTYWEEDLKPAIDNLRAAWEEIWPVIEPIVNIIEGGIRMMAENVALALGIIVDLIQGDFSGAWDKFKEMVGNAVQFARDTLGNLGTFLAELLPRLGEAAKALGKAALEGLKDGAEKAWNDVVKPFLKDLPDNIKDGIGELGELLVDAGKAALKGLLKGAEWLWDNEVQPFLKNLPGNIKDGIGDVAELLLEKGKDVLTGLKNGVVWIWDNELKPFLTDLPGSIVDAIGDVSKLLWNVGKAIVQGLVDGMKSVPIPNPVDWIKDKTGLGGDATYNGNRPTFDEQVMSDGPMLATPTGAYGQSLVWDDVRKAWVYPGTVGSHGDARTGYGAPQGVTVVIQGDVYARDHTEQGLATGDLNFLAGLQTAGAR